MSLHKSTYILVSVMLSVPVFFWPLLIFIGMTPSFGVDVVAYWLLAAGVVLVAAVVADSVLLGCSTYLLSVSSMLWVLAATYTVALAIRHDESAWLLGLLFLLHSFRSAYLMWQGRSDWWLWPAWCRDMALSVAVFGSLSFWPVVI